MESEGGGVTGLGEMNGGGQHSTMNQQGQEVKGELQRRKTISQHVRNSHDSKFCLGFRLFIISADSEFPV